MTATTQLIGVGVLVALATAYVLRATWRTWGGASGKGCGSGCGKCATVAAEPQKTGRFPLPLA